MAISTGATSTLSTELPATGVWKPHPVWHVLTSVSSAGATTRTPWALSGVGRWTILRPLSMVPSTTTSKWSMYASLTVCYTWFGGLIGLQEAKGIPGVKAERLAEAFTVKHCALSLVGEPIIYPEINRCDPNRPHNIVYANSFQVSWFVAQQRN